MTIWVLLLISGLNTPKIQMFVNTFDTKAKCEKRIAEMEKSYSMACVETVVNK